MPKDIKFIKIDCKIIQWSRRQQAVNACIQFLPNMCECECVVVCVCAAIEEFSCLVGYWTRKFLGNVWQYGRVVCAGRRHLSVRRRRRHWPRNVCIKIFMGHSITIWKRAPTLSAAGWSTKWTVDNRGQQAALWTQIAFPGDDISNAEP